MIKQTDCNERIALHRVRHHANNLRQFSDISFKLSKASNIDSQFLRTHLYFIFLSFLYALVKKNSQIYLLCFNFAVSNYPDDLFNLRFSLIFGPSKDFWI